MEKSDYVQFLEELEEKGFARLQDYEADMYEFRRDGKKLKYAQVTGKGKYSGGGKVGKWSRADTTTLIIQFGIGDRFTRGARVG